MIWRQLRDELESVSYLIPQPSHTALHSWKQCFGSKFLHCSSVCLVVGCKHNMTTNHCLSYCSHRVTSPVAKWYLGGINMKCGCVIFVTVSRRVTSAAALIADYFGGTQTFRSEIYANHQKALGLEAPVIDASLNCLLQQASKGTRQAQDLVCTLTQASEHPKEGQEG